MFDTITFLEIVALLILAAVIIWYFSFPSEERERKKTLKRFQKAVDGYNVGLVQIHSNTGAEWVIPTQDNQIRRYTPPTRRRGGSLRTIPLTQDELTAAMSRPFPSITPQNRNQPIDPSTEETECAHTETKPETPQPEPQPPKSRFDDLIE
jgi:hypothetical protein